MCDRANITFINSSFSPGDNFGRERNKEGTFQRTEKTGEKTGSGAYFVLRREWKLGLVFFAKWRLQIKIEERKRRERERERERMENIFSENRKSLFAQNCLFFSLSSSLKRKNNQRGKRETHLLLIDFFFAVASMSFMFFFQWLLVRSG